MSVVSGDGPTPSADRPQARETRVLPAVSKVAAAWMCALVLTRLVRAWSTPTVTASVLLVVAVVFLSLAQRGAAGRMLVTVALAQATGFLAAVTAAGIEGSSWQVCAGLAGMLSAVAGVWLLVLLRRSRGDAQGPGFDLLLWRLVTPVAVYGVCASAATGLVLAVRAGFVLVTA